MKTVLLSIKPKYCELIASGKKTVEIRKNRPNIDVPFKVYIYETKAEYISRNGRFSGQGKVIGEFICDSIQWNNASDLWIAEDAEITLEGTCLTKEDMYKYLGAKSGTSRNDKKYEFYAWHISDLVIYDKPKELSEFYHSCNPSANDGSCYGCRYAVGLSHETGGVICENVLTRPPQSWCYVEEIE